MEQVGHRVGEMTGIGMKAPAQVCSGLQNGWNNSSDIHGMLRNSVGLIYLICGI